MSNTPQNAELIAGTSAGDSFATPHVGVQNEESACSNVPKKSKSKARVQHNGTDVDMKGVSRKLNAALRRVDRLEKENAELKQKLSARSRPSRLPK